MPTTSNHLQSPRMAIVSFPTSPSARLSEPNVEQHLTCVLWTRGNIIYTEGRGAEKGGQTGDTPPKLRTSIADIPDSLLEKIFLSVAVDGQGHNKLLMYMGVCKQWKQVLQSAQIGITLPRWFGIGFAPRQILTLSNLSSLTLDGCNCVGFSWAPFFKSLGEECKLLRELSLRQVTPSLDQAGATSLISNLTSLHSLLIDKSILTIRLLPFATLPLLHTLHIEGAILNTKTLKHISLTTTLRSLAFKTILGLRTLPPLAALTNIETLEINNLHDLQSLPRFDTLPKLLSLSLRSFPPELLHSAHLQSLTSLQTLTLESVSTPGAQPQAVSGLTNLTKLHTLQLHGFAPGHPGELLYLSSLERLTVTLDTTRAPLQFSGLSSLRHLAILDSNGLERTFRDRQTLPSFQNLPSLSHLDLDWLYMYDNGMDVLQSLEKSAGSNDRRVTISLLDEPFKFFSMRMPSTSITKLALDGLWTIVERRAIRSGLFLLPNLTSLDLSGIEYSPMPALPAMRGLRELQLAKFGRGDLSLLDRFPTLTSLSLKKLRADVRIQMQLGVFRLQKLSIHSWDVLILPPVMHLYTILSLEILSCNFVTDIPTLQGLASLRSLKVHDCDRLQRVPPLMGLVSLTQLSLIGLGSLYWVPPLEGLTGVSVLEIAKCPQLRAVPELRSLRGLRSADLSDCRLLERAPSLRGLPLLMRVDLRGCDGLSEAPDTEGLSHDLDLILPSRFV